MANVQDRTTILTLLKIAVEGLDERTLGEYGFESFTTLIMDDKLVVQFGDMKPYLVEVEGPVRLTVERPKDKEPQKTDKTEKKPPVQKDKPEK